MSYSIDPRDWSLPGVQAIVNGVVQAAFAGAVVDLHDGGQNRAETVAALPQIISDLEGEGYSFVSICGSAKLAVPQTSAVYSFAAAPSAGQPITSNAPLVGATISPGNTGYWLAAADGAMFAFGGAGFYGSLPGVNVHPAALIVGMAATPTAAATGWWRPMAESSPSATPRFPARWVVAHFLVRSWG